MQRDDGDADKDAGTEMAEVAVEVQREADTAADDVDDDGDGDDDDQDGYASGLGPSSSATHLARVATAHRAAIERTHRRVAGWKRRVLLKIPDSTSAYADHDNVDGFGTEDQVLTATEDLGATAKACLFCCTPACAVGKCCMLACGAYEDDDPLQTLQLSIPPELSGRMAGALEEADTERERGEVISELDEGDPELYRKADRELTGMPGFELLTSVVEPNQMYGFWWQRYREAGVRPPTERAFALRDPLVNLSPPPLSYSIANSGGGVRSGAFCLGAWQSLDASKRLGMHRAEYVSSVSGGGFTATAYLSHLCKLKHEARAERAARRVAALDPAAQEDAEFMRVHDLAAFYEAFGGLEESPDEPEARRRERAEAEDRELKSRALDELAARMPAHGRYMSLCGQLLTGVFGPFLMNLAFLVSLAVLLTVLADAIGVGKLLREAAADADADFYTSDYFYMVMAGVAGCAAESAVWIGLSLTGDKRLLYQHLVPHGKAGTLLFGSLAVYSCSAWALTVGELGRTTTVPFLAGTYAWMALVIAFHTSRRPDLASKRDGSASNAAVDWLRALPAALFKMTLLVATVVGFAAVTWYLLVERDSADFRDETLRYAVVAALLGLALVHATMDIWVRMVHTHYRRSLRSAFYATSAAGQRYDPKVSDLDELLPTGPYWIGNVTYNGFSPLPDTRAQESRAVDRHFGAVSFTPVTFGSPDFGFVEWASMPASAGSETRISKVMAWSGAAFGSDFGRLSTKLGFVQQIIVGCTGSGLGDWFHRPSPLNSLSDFHIRRYINKWQPVVLGAIALAVLLTSHGHWKWVVGGVMMTWLLFFFVSLFNPTPPRGTGGPLNRASRYLRHLSPMVRLFHTSTLHSVARETVPDDLSLTDGGHQENNGVFPLLRRRRTHIVSLVGEGGPRFETLRKVVGACTPFQHRRGLIATDATHRGLAWLHHDLVVDCDVKGVHFLPPPGALDPENVPFTAERMPTEMARDGQPYYLFRLRYYVERQEDGSPAPPEPSHHPEGAAFPVDPVPAEGRPGFSVVDGWMLYVDKSIDPDEAEAVRRPARLPHRKTFPDHPTGDQYSYGEDAFSCYAELGRRNTDSALRRYGDLFLAGPPPPVSDEVARSLHARMWNDYVGTSLEDVERAGGTDAAARS